MVKRSLNWNLDCWYLDFPAPKRDSKRYVFPTKSKMVLHNCSCRVSNNDWRLRRFGCWTNYGERCISGKTWSAQPCEDLCPQRKQRFHKAWDSPEIPANWTYSLSRNKLKKIFHMDLYQPLIFHQKIPWCRSKPMALCKSSLHLAKLAENEPGQWELANGVFVVAKSLQILDYLWIICGWFVDYLWIICGCFCQFLLVEDLQSWSKSKSSARNLPDATVARAILSLRYGPRQRHETGIAVWLWFF